MPDTYKMSDHRLSSFSQGRSMGQKAPVKVIVGEPSKTAGSFVKETTIKLKPIATRGQGKVGFTMGEGGGVMPSKRYSGGGVREGTMRKRGLGR